MAIPPSLNVVYEEFDTIFFCYNQHINTILMCLMSSYKDRKLCSKCTNALWSRGKVWLYCRIEPDVHVGGYWSASGLAGAAMENYSGWSYAQHSLTDRGGWPKWLLC